MTLAQVVYSISNDKDFAEKNRSDPEAALARKGLKLSKEEQAFLAMGFKRYSPDSQVKLNLTTMGFYLGGWFG